MRECATAIFDLTPFDASQCLLQQSTNLIVAALTLLVQLYKKIGSGLESLVNGAGVLAVRSHSLEPLDKTMKEREGLVVYIVNCNTLTLFTHI